MALASPFVEVPGLRDRDDERFRTNFVKMIHRKRRNKPAAECNQSESSADDRSRRPRNRDQASGNTSSQQRRPEQRHGMLVTCDANQPVEEQCRQQITERRDHHDEHHRNGDELRRRDWTNKAETKAESDVVGFECISPGLREGTRRR